MHDTHQSNVLDPLPHVTTLDGDRADAIGALLATEAETDADTAGTPPPGRRTVRRVLVGTAAAAVLAGALLVVNGVVGGPGAAKVPAAVAVERADGWTTVTIRDPQATPSQIERELEAAGIDARIEPLPVHGDGDGIVTIDGVASVRGGPLGPDAGSSISTMGAKTYTLVTFGGADPGELAGVELEFDLGAELPPPSASNWQAWHADYEQKLERTGIRLHDQATNRSVRPSVSIRDGADVDLVLYTQP